jgi:prepilin-type N-terminal cleavage/methylation domain-containing protein
MQKQTIKSKQEGFTIIEVLIVLAIAALILLVVFLAVPGLQRSNSNNATTQEATRIASAITNFTANNNGSLPANATDLSTIASDSGILKKLTFSIASVHLPINTAIVGPPAFPAAATGVWYITSAASLGAAQTVPQVTTPGAAVVYIASNESCDTNTKYGPSLQTSGYKSGKVALFYTTQTTGNPNWNCIDAQQ